MRTPSTPDITDAIRAIRALSQLHGSHSTLDEGRVIDAIQAGRAAYWTTQSYHNQAAGSLLEVANTHSLETALRLVAQPYSGNIAASPAYLLGTLIPLNRQARRDINEQWDRLSAEATAIERARAARPAPMFAEAAE